MTKMSVLAVFLLSNSHFSLRTFVWESSFSSSSGCSMIGESFKVTIFTVIIIIMVASSWFRDVCWLLWRVSDFAWFLLWRGRKFGDVKSLRVAIFVHVVFWMWMFCGFEFGWCLWKGGHGVNSWPHCDVRKK